MNQSESVEETIFHAAQQLGDAPGRTAYLDEVCAGDAELRQRVERLLQAGDRAKQFFAGHGVGSLAKTGGTLKLEPIQELPGSRIGRYRLLEQIGEGGCGVVYVAEQEEPVRRRVALKVIKLGMDTESVIARFEAERQALALMDHPHIAKVLDAGATEAGRPYFVMELVRGIRITDYCDQNNLSTRERLDLFIEVCHAIQHAHQKGIIHRDIKPSNILVTLHDGVPVPKVIDFGIAKATTQQRLTDKTIYTAFEQFIGTPAYMSPEQAEMSGLDIDTRSDIYALGVLLYELLTGATPFDPGTLLSAGLDEMRRILREEQPLRPSTRITQDLGAADVSPRISTGISAVGAEAEVGADSRRRLRLKEQVRLVQGDLDWIVMKCLEKDRTRRYETANGLALDVERHRRHEPVSAGPPSLTYRTQKFVRRNKVAVLAGAAVAVALVLGAVASSWQAVRATRAQREESRQRQRAEENERQAEQARAREAAQRQMAEEQYYCASIGQAQALMDQGQYGRAKQILAQTNLTSWSGWEWGWLERQCNFDLMTLTGGGEGLTGIAYSPDGRWIAAGCYDATVRMWDAETGVASTPLRGHNSTVVLLGFSPDSRRLVTGSFDGTARVWDIRTGQSRLALAGHSNGVWCAIFSPDAKTIATGGGDRTVRLWDAASGAVLGRFEAGSDIVMCVAFSPDGRHLAYGGGSGNTWARSADNAVRIADLATGELRLLRGHTHSVSGIAFHPDGRRLATASWDGTARLGDVQSGAELSPFYEMSGLGGLLTIAFSPDGKLCAVAGAAMGPEKAEAGVHLIDVETHRNVQVFEGHARMVRSVAFSRDGTRVASASLDGTVRVWPVPALPQFLSLEGHDHAVWTLAASPDGRFVATGSLDGTARLWSLEDGRLWRTLAVGYPVVSLAFTPDGNRLLTAAGHGTALLWDLHLDAEAWDSAPPSPDPILVLKSDADTVLCVAVSPDGLHFIAGSKDGAARVWNTKSGRVVQVLQGHTSAVLSAAFSPDGQRVATASADGTTRVWDIGTGRALLLLSGHTNQVLQVAWSPDGERIATGSQDGTIRLWDGQTGALLLPPLEGHRDGVSSLVFSPDGRRLATAAGGTALPKGHTLDNSVFLWDVATGQSLLRLRPHFNVVRSVAFAGDGTWLVTGSADNTARAHRAFSWRQDAEVGDTDASPAERFERHKREYWARWLAVADDLASPRPGRRIDSRLYEFNVAAEPRLRTRPLRAIPSRDSTATTNQIDLAEVYNVALEESFVPVLSLDDLDVDLSAVPVGLQTLADVPFDVRGLVQLGRQGPEWRAFPVQVQIPVGRSFQVMHVLHGALGAEADGAVIGSYRLHYVDGQIAEVEIRYGRDLCDWRDGREPKSLGEHTAIGWMGRHWAGSPARENLRLFRTTYPNPRSGVAVRQLEFVSKMMQSAPLLVALTVE